MRDFQNAGAKGTALNTFSKKTRCNMVNIFFCDNFVNNKN